MSELDWFSRIIAQASQNPKACISTEELLDIGRECFGDETVEELQRSWPQREAPTQEASTLGDYSSTIVKLQLQYQRKKVFTLPDDWPNVDFSKDTEERVMAKIRDPNFYLDASLSNFVVENVLFDLLSTNAEALAAKNMTLRQNYPVMTRVPDGGGFIKGTADYALDDYLIILTRHPQASDPLIAYSQVLAYMRGVQQRRVATMPGSKVKDTTYGIVSDGINWDCYKLKGDKLYFATSYGLDWGRGKVCRFLDHIIKSCIKIAPTCPNKRLHDD